MPVFETNRIFVALFTILLFLIIKTMSGSHSYGSYILFQIMLIKSTTSLSKVLMKSYCCLKCVYLINIHHQIANITQLLEQLKYNLTDLKKKEKILVSKDLTSCD